MNTVASNSTEALPESILKLNPEETRLGASLLQLALRRLRRDYLTLLALSILAVLMLISFSAPLITKTLDLNYTETNAAEEKYLPLFSEGHPLGTDHLGRDHLARLLYAGRVSIGIGVSAGFISIMLGTTIGLIAGYYQGGRLGFVDDGIIWFTTTLNSIPTLMLLILIASLQKKPNLITLVAVLVLVSWSGTMRLVRGETLSHREREYVVSARAIGARPWRIMFTHILPNVFSVFIIALALEIGTLILTEAALSFVGLGVRPPDSSWGSMLTEAQDSMRKAPYLSVFPGVMIVTTVLCLYLIGDGLRDAFDPQAKKHN